MNLKCVVLVVFSVFLGVQAAPENRIIGGEDILVLPYACRVISFTGYTGSVSVGRLYSGFFLTRSRVVTVALALDGFDNWRIEYGFVLSRYTSSRNAVKHEGYVREVLLHNVGIIDLDEPVDSNIVISLPVIVAPPVAAGFIQVFGYGWTAYEGELALHLQRLFMAVTDRPTCVAAFGTHIANQNVICATTMIINGAICNGDQGGPALEFPSAFNVVGLTSFWLGRCDTTTAPFGIVTLINYEEFLQQPSISQN